MKSDNAATNQFNNTNGLPTMIVFIAQALIWKTGNYVVDMFCEVVAADEL